MADLKTQLNNLAKLQEVDTQIFCLRRSKGAIPEEIKAITTAFDEKKVRLASLEKESLDLQKQKKETELELGSKEEATKKLQCQLYSLKTNKEYQTMLQQIADSKADYSCFEDKILLILEQIDKKNSEIETEKISLKQEEKIFSEQKKRIESRIKEIDEKIAQLEAQRTKIIPDIDPKILTQYEKILLSREGMALAAIENNSCLGCNMFVPPQVLNLIQMYEHIITCETCNRMLYVRN